MADLSDIQSAGITRITGSDSTGVEQTPVQSTAQGSLHVNLRDSTGAEEGTTTNPFMIQSASKISTGNSSTTPLGSNGVFTGTAEDVLNYGTIVVACTASHAGTLKLQWSVNGTSWIDDGDVYTVNAGSLKKTSYGPVAQFFRVVFTNNASAQSSFTLTTILKASHTKPSTHKASESISDDSDAELVKALMTGRRASDNTYGNAQLNTNNHLLVQFSNSYTRVTGNTTSTAKSGSGVLHGILVGANWTGGVATIYDNTAGSGTVIAQLDFGSPSGGLLSTSGLPGPVFLGPLGVPFSTGLTVVTSGSGSNDITLIYQ